MSKKTPKSPATGGHEERDSKPDARPSGPRFGDTETTTGGHTSDESGPVSRPRSASSGAEDMYELDAGRVPFEDPERRDSVREIGSVEEDE